MNIPGSEATTSGSLARWGTLMIAVPVVIQLLLVAAFWQLRLLADEYAVAAGKARETSIAMQEIICKEIAILCPLRESALQAVKLSGEDNLENLRFWVARLQDPMYCGASQEQKLVAHDMLRKTEALLHLAGQRPNQIGNLKADLRQAVVFLSRNMPAPLVDTDQQKRRHLLLDAIVAGSFLNASLLVVLILKFNRSIVSRLVVILDNSHRLALGRKLLPALPGDDEINALDRCFHEMADTINDMAHKQDALIENARDVLCCLDDKARFFTVSEAAIKVLGYQPEELKGMWVGSVLAPEQRQASLGAMRQLIDSCGDSSFEVPVLRNDNTVFPALWSARWSQQEQKMFCVVHDISEHKAAQQRRRQIVQMVSHDLKSPLAAMGVIHTLLEDTSVANLNDQGRQFLTSSQTNTTRMLALITDLLDMEKMEAGMLEVSKTTVSVQAIFERSMQSVLALAGDNGIKLKCLPTDCTVYGDEGRLVQVIVNLLGNAIKFSPAQGTVTLCAASMPGFVEISVSDEGRGIPEHLARSIFDRFCQVESKDAKEKGGTGLGLAICKALVELHGGDISARRNPDRGSTFSFRIPIQ